MKFSKFTLLLGRNGSGKSTVLEALAMLPHPLLGLSIIGHPRAKYIARVLHGAGGENPYTCFIYRYHGTGLARYSVFNNEVLEVRVRPSSITLARDGERGVFGEELAKLFGIPRDFLDHSVVFLPGSDAFHRDLRSAIYREWSMVERRGSHVRIIRELVGKHVDEGFTEVMPRFDELYVRKELSDGYSMYLRLNDMGSGVERAILYLLWLDSVRPKLVLWDDLGANLHSSLVGEIVDWLLQGDWQVVATLQNPWMLEQLLELESEDIKLLLLERVNDVLKWEVLRLGELPAQTGLPTPPSP